MNSKLNALSVDESRELSLFIGDCVRKNRNFSIQTGRIGTSNLSIQELYNLNVSTLQEIGAVVHKINASKAGLPESLGGSGETKFSGVPGSKLVKVLDFIVREKNDNELKALKRAELKQLELTKNANKSVTAIRKETEAKIKALKAELGEEVEN